MSLHIIIWNVSYNVIIGTPAHHTGNTTKIRASISRRLVTNTASTLTGEPSAHANSLKTQDYTSSATYLD